MAEIQSTPQNRKDATPRTQKKSTRIDMTAMVDVAFLLLTFFVLTATMTDKSMMELVMPPNEAETDREPLVDDRIMTLLLQEHDRVGYYIGYSQASYHETDFSSKGLRKVLMDFLAAPEGMTRCKTGTGARIVRGCWDPIILVKAHKNSRYRNLVDVLDELAIVSAPKYAIDRFSETDSLIVIGQFDYYSEAANP